LSKNRPLTPSALLVACLAGLPLLLLAAPSDARVFTVTTAGDSGPGSLREAITEANARPGPDSIHFDIPGGGPHTIDLVTTLPFIIDPVTIDGFTQGGEGSFLVEIDGTALGSDPSSLLVVQGHHFGGHGDGSRLRGMTLQNTVGTNSWGIAVGADGVVVEDNRFRDNYGGVVIFGESEAPDAIEPKADAPKNNVVRHCDVDTSSEFGIVTALARNSSIHDNTVTTTGNTGIVLFLSDHSEVAYNEVSDSNTGITVDGGHFNDVHRNLIVDSPANGIVVWNNSSRNQILHNEILDPGENGIFLISGATLNTVEANYVEATLNGIQLAFTGPQNLVGSNEIRNTLNGVQLAFTQENTVASNDISNPASQGAAGVFLGGASSNTIEGNTISDTILGVDSLFSGALIVRGNDLNSNDVGIQNLVGGNANLIEGNRIYDNGTGILIASLSAILENSIFDNLGLGIDRNDDGVDPPGELPSIDSAETNGNAISVRGMFTGETGKQYRLDFYASDASDPSGFGEGQHWLGFHKVQTDGLGEVRFSFRRNYPAATQGGYATATATLLDGDFGEVKTSEFSGAVEIESVDQLEPSSLTLAPQGGSTALDTEGVPDLSGLTLEEAAAVIESWDVDDGRKRGLLRAIQSVQKLGGSPPAVPSPTNQ
jgi:parallel beta-helix repeat protein